MSVPLVVRRAIINIIIVVQQRLGGQLILVGFIIIQEKRSKIMSRTKEKNLIKELVTISAISISGMSWGIIIGWAMLKFI